MRVVICGSRTWTDQEAISTVLWGLLVTAQDSFEDLVIIQGMAKGADHMARHFYGGICPICNDVYGEHDHVKHEPYPADWELYGKAAGPIRNQQMLDLGKPELVVAFCESPTSKGTWDMVKRAHAAGIRTWIVGHG